MTTQTIKGYKAFNDDLTCHNFKYKIGETYKIEDKIKLCERGFHFCHKAPFDVFSYYSVIDEYGDMRRFAKVSAPASKVIYGDEKVVTSEITIEEEVSFSDLIKAQIQDTFIHFNDFLLLSKTNYCSQMNNPNGACPQLQVAATGDGSSLAASNDMSCLATTGDYSTLATTGHKSRLATTGDGSQVATTGSCSQVTTISKYSKVATTGSHSQVAAIGDSSILTTTGFYSQVAAIGDCLSLGATGDNSRLTATGNGSNLAATGDKSCLTAIGDHSHLTATGDNSRLTATGDYSRCFVTGQNGVISISGRWGCFKGENGTYVSIADFDEEGKCVGFVTGCIGEDGLKANVWYTVNNGNFVKYKGCCE